MSRRYKIVLAIRFSGYLVFFTGLITFIFLLGPLLQAEFKYRKDRIFGVRRTVPNIVISSDTQVSSSGGPVSFDNVKAIGNTIIPASTEYGIVIEKINANAKVIADVNAGDEIAYKKALSQGVAAALGSTLPGQPGNLFLFSHSTDAPWNIIRFNAIFYLLKELEIGDRVIIFYKAKRYDYIVFDKNIVEPSDVSFLTNKYDTPVLTLQTCDPPGTLFKRLVVRAKLVSS